MGDFLQTNAPNLLSKFLEDKESIEKLAKEIAPDNTGQCKLRLIMLRDLLENSLLPLATWLNRLPEELWHETLIEEFGNTDEEIAINFAVSQIVIRSFVESLQLLEQTQNKTADDLITYLREWSIAERASQSYMKFIRNLYCLLKSLSRSSAEIRKNYEQISYLEKIMLRFDLPLEYDELFYRPQIELRKRINHVIQEMNQRNSS